MKKILFVLLAFSSSKIYAQNPVIAIENKPHALTERYQLMKANSETYQDYKVIKEYILDGVWKIAADTMAKRTGQLAEANAKIKTLQNELAQTRSDLKMKDDSQAEIVFASAHINVLGRSFSKGVFLVLCVVVAVSLVVLIFFLLVRMRVMQMMVAENKVVVASISNEFNEYKRNALAKEVKLSRELQTERNKLAEIKTQRT